LSLTGHSADIDTEWLFRSKQSEVIINTSEFRAIISVVLAPSIPWQGIHWDLAGRNNETKIKIARNGIIGFMVWF
jgi:hypothetical protein